MGTYYRGLCLKKLGFDLDADSVLEVGCHDGYILSNVKANRKIGIDINPIRLYREIKYVKSDFLKHDFNGDVFDQVVSLEVMEHVPNPEKFLQNLGKVISDNGKALLSVPSKQMRIFPFIFQDYIDKRWGHEYRRGYSAEELHHLLSNKFNNKKFKIISWNCPFWRTAYIPMKFLWRVSPGLTKRILNLTIVLDKKFGKGRNGFFYVLIG